MNIWGFQIPAVSFQGCNERLQTNHFIKEPYEATSRIDCHKVFEHWTWILPTHEQWFQDPVIWIFFLVEIDIYIYMYRVHDYHSVYYIGMLPLPLTVASEGFSGSPTKLAGGDCYCIALVSYVCIDCSKGVGKRITIHQTLMSQTKQSWVASFERVPMNLHVSGQIIVTKLPVGRPKWWKVRESTSYIAFAQISIHPEVFLDKKTLGTFSVLCSSFLAIAIPFPLSFNSP